MWLTRWLQRNAPPAASPRSTSDRAAREVRRRDGSGSVLCTPDGASHFCVILDVSAGGMRLHTGASLRVGQSITCRVAFARHNEVLRLRVVWCREGEVGTRYDPVLPGTRHLLENYKMRVCNRAA